MSPSKLQEWVEIWTCLSPVLGGHSNRYNISHCLWEPVHTFANMAIEICDGGSGTSVFIFNRVFDFISGLPLQLIPQHLTCHSSFNQEHRKSCYQSVFSIGNIWGEWNLLVWTPISPAYHTVKDTWGTYVVQMYETWQWKKYTVEIHLWT